MFRRYPFLLVFFVIAALIFSAYYFHRPFSALYDTEFALLDSTRIYYAQVLEDPVIRSHSVRVKVLLDGFEQKATFFLYSSSPDSLPEVDIGDVLRVRTAIHCPAADSISKFDYGRYLRLNHEVGVAYIRAGNWQVVDHRAPHGIRQHAMVLRHRLLQRFVTLGFRGEELAVLSAITLGERSAMSSTLQQTFAAAGAAHVLAVSGLHTAIIFSFVWMILTLFGRFPPRYHNQIHSFILTVLSTLIMIGYAFLTGLNPPVVRAVIMITIIQVGLMLHRQPISINSLAAAAVFSLLIDPLSLFSVSFQFSFAAVLAIILFVPPFNDVLYPSSKSVLYIGRKEIQLNNSFTRYLCNLISMSVAAQIGTMPFALYYFGQFSNYFLLTNIVIIPLASFIIVPLSFIVLLFASTPVAPFLAGVLNISVQAMCGYTKWVESLPLSTTSLSINFMMMLCLITAIATIYIAFQRNRFGWFIATFLSMVGFCFWYIF